MKKLLLTAVLVALSVATYAQGTVNFSNYGIAARRVNYSSDPLDYNVAADYTTLHGTGANGGFTVGLYYQTTAGGAYTAYANTTPMLSGATAGYFKYGTATLDGTSAGSAYNLIVKAWQSSYASYDAAFATPGAWVGASSPFSVTLGGGNIATPALAFSAFTLHQIASPVIPEPTTIAFGLFGVAGLFLARRRQ